MDRSEICAPLDARGSWYEITEHPAVFNMAEVAAITLPYPDADAKSLFVRDDKKRNRYLITVKGDKKVEPQGLPAGPPDPPAVLRVRGRAAGHPGAHPRCGHPARRPQQ